MALAGECTALWSIEQGLFYLNSGLEQLPHELASPREGMRVSPFAIVALQMARSAMRDTY